MQKPDENSRNAMGHGLLAVPESLPRQEDKENSACRELQMNRLLKSEHAMKSHTYRINRGVHCASWERSCTTSFAATSGDREDS